MNKEFFESIGFKETEPNTLVFNINDNKKIVVNLEDLVISTSIKSSNMSEMTFMFFNEDNFTEENFIEFFDRNGGKNKALNNTEINFSFLAKHEFKEIREKEYVKQVNGSKQIIIINFKTKTVHVTSSNENNQNVGLPIITQERFTKQEIEKVINHFNK